MDPVFRDAEQLRRLYPQLVHLGMTGFSSPDVLRFMGKRVRPDGTTVRMHELPIGSDLKVRPNGVRIKRRLGPREAIALGAADRSRRWTASPKRFSLPALPGLRPLHARRSAVDAGVLQTLQ
jgi:hypothetical protein